MNHAHRLGRVLAVILAFATSSRAAAEGLRLGASAGAGQAYGQTYFNLGGRVGYDVALGLTPEVGVTFWMGNSPTFVQVSPGLTWYIPLPLLRPYVGGFYAHDFVSAGFPDQDSIGARAGIGLLGVGPVSVNIGGAYARRLSCSVSCDSWWPEATAGFSF